MAAAALRTVNAQPDRQSAGVQLQQVAASMAVRWPKASAVPQAAEEDALAYMAFPGEHWTRIYSTNPLERLNRDQTDNERGGHSPGRGLGG
jgi:putative transposase